MTQSTEVLLYLIGCTSVMVGLIAAVIYLIELSKSQFQRGIKWAETQQSSRLNVATRRVKRQLETQLRDNSNEVHDIPTLRAVLRLLEDDKGTEPNAST